MKIIIFSLSVLMLFTACGGKVDASKTADATPFFDVKGFFHNEIKRLTEGGTKIEKTVTVRGQSETKMIDKANFAQELALFVASDINKPAWRDKYRIEKTAGRSLESFFATDDDLKTKRIDIFRFPPNGVTQIQILNSDESSITESQQSLKYELSVGYSIETFQKFIGSDSSKTKIQVVFVK
ncbi:MAG: hypothetical protein U5L45_20040 [Saprospiraceae bacterium]|nr:hypothetical protein [Saprospiraceae bacterium]